MVRNWHTKLKKPPGWVAPSAPLSMRKQVFLPEFTIALRYNPSLSPRYASFEVPLNFNKLDMRDYLKRVYGVHILSVRSYVEQQKVTRAKRFGKPGYGPLRRPMSKKRMTVELKEPFVWPDEPEDMSAWEQDQYNKAYQYETDYQKKHQPDAVSEPDKEAREMFEKAFSDMREERQPWRPTWQALGLNYDRAAVWKTAKGKEDSTESGSS